MHSIQLVVGFVHLVFHKRQERQNTKPQSDTIWVKPRSHDHFPDKIAVIAAEEDGWMTL
jgi:hypothetical protein